MTRTYEPGIGWIVDPVRRLCPCGAPVTRRVGKGRPFTYCDAHAPARRAYMTRYFTEHAGELCEYNRRRDGSRPIRSFTCADCGQATRGYSGNVLCQRCRQLARHR